MKINEIKTDDNLEIWKLVHSESIELTDEQKEKVQEIGNYLCGSANEIVEDREISPPEHYDDDIFVMDFNEFFAEMIEEGWEYETKEEQILARIAVWENLDYLESLEEYLYELAEKQGRKFEDK